MQTFWIQIILNYLNIRSTCLQILNREDILQFIQIQYDVLQHSEFFMENHKRSMQGYLPNWNQSCVYATIFNIT